MWWIWNHFPFHKNYYFVIWIYKEKRKFFFLDSTSVQSTIYGALLWRWYWKTINYHRHHWLKIFYHCGLDEGQSSTGKRFLFVAFGHLDSRFAAWWCNRTLLNCAQVMINGLEIKLTIFHWENGTQKKNNGCDSKLFLHGF